MVSPCESVGRVEGLIVCGNRFRQAGVEFACGDLFSVGLSVAELAVREVAVGHARGWAEGAAEDGAVQVQIAGSAGRVQDGTGLIVGEILERAGGFVILCEDAASGIAGKAGGEAGDGVGYSVANALGANGIRLREKVEAGAQAACILMRDGENAMAALGAAGTAGQVRAAADGGGGEGCVDDLNEVRQFVGPVWLSGDCLISGTFLELGCGPGSYRAEWLGGFRSER